MIKISKNHKKQREHDAGSPAEGDYQSDISSDLEIEKILKFCADSGFPLHTVHGDVTYHFVTTNIYICPKDGEAANKKEQT